MSSPIAEETNLLAHLYQKIDSLISYYQRETEITENAPADQEPKTEELAITKIEPATLYTINGPFNTVLRVSFSQKLFKQKEWSLLENNVIKALNKGVVKPIDEIGIKIFYHHQSGKKIAEIKLLGIHGHQRVIGYIDESNGMPLIIFNKYLKKK